MNFCLNYDLPGFKSGTVVDADVATKRLSQIYGTEGLGEDEEAREAEGVGGVVEEESGAVGEIRVAGFGGVLREEPREVRRRHGVVEEIFAADQIAGVETERCFHVE